MKIPDDIRQTVADVAGRVLERGQQFGKEAQLQVQVKRLQVEHARKIHELGKKTYAWYQSGTMIASGPVPADVTSLCSQISDTEKTIAATNAEIEAVREQAALSASGTVHSTLDASTPTSATTASQITPNQTRALDASSSTPSSGPSDP